MAVLCFNQIQWAVLTEGTQALEKPSSQGMSKGIIQVRLPFRFWADDHNCWKESNISLLLPYTNWSWFLFSSHYPFDQPSWEVSENSPIISLFIIFLFLRSHTHTQRNNTNYIWFCCVWEHTFLNNMDRLSKFGCWLRFPGSWTLALLFWNVLLLPNQR